MATGCAQLAPTLQCTRFNATHLELEEVGPRPVEVPAVAFEALDRERHDQAGPLGQLLDERPLLRIGLQRAIRDGLVI